MSEPRGLGPIQRRLAVVGSILAISLVGLLAERHHALTFAAFLFVLGLFIIGISIHRMTTGRWIDGSR